jgi:8-oxo-dGTP pyrophosphatase MutT (NUDIX family)
MFMPFLTDKKKEDTARLQRQFAALPYVRDGAVLSILLLTSRETRRWVIPKGWPIKKRTGYETAEIEARQEAGVTGRISRTPLGSYTYRKRLHVFSSVMCEVEVYPLAVLEQKMKWRERAVRQLIWVPPEEAADRVDEPELAALIREFRPDAH